MGRQTLAYDGRWHLADEATADNLIPGRLKVSRRGGGRLRLYGSLAGTSLGDITPEHHRIVGRVGHRPWTLENCFPLRWSPINDEPERWYVELALSGAALLVRSAGAWITPSSVAKTVTLSLPMMLLSLVGRAVRR